MHSCRVDEAHYGVNMKSQFIVLALAASVVLLSGCAASDSDESSPVGVWGATPDSGDAYLELTDDGSLAGSDGCNRLIGGWSAENETTITFTALGSTRMACEGVDTWLSDAASAELDGKTLTVLGASGDSIGTLTKQE